MTAGQTVGKEVDHVDSGTQQALSSEASTAASPSPAEGSGGSAAAIRAETSSEGALIPDYAEEAPVKQEEILDIAIDTHEVYERGRVDINFFAALALPDVCIEPLPMFYVLAWQLLTQRKTVDMGRIMRFALGLPRGHAKTTFIKILICWLIVYDKVSFVLIVCASESLAENLMSDVNDILSSSNIEQVYGSWSGVLGRDRNDLKTAWYHNRSVILAAKGAESALRGLNLKNRRPDLIFCDDVQTKENDKSEPLRQNLLEWLSQTLFKAIATRGDRWIIYVGNMYSEECILNQLHNNPRWVSLITGAILADGTPLWPALFSLEDLMESFEHDEALGMAAQWFAEVMNDPVAAGNSLLPHLLPNLPEDIDEELQDPDGAYLTVDPAGFKRQSDDNVISLHYVVDGKNITWDRIFGKDIADPEQLVLKMLTMALEHGASVIGIEDVAYQSTLQFWVTKYMKESNITGITIVPLNPGGRPKEGRILTYIQDLYAQNSYQHPRARPAFVYQATKYKLGKPKQKDDIMDCDAYSMDMRNQYWHMICNNRRRSLSAPGGGRARVVDNNTPF